jgi:acyl-coenzyme A synthetase/AMP-(fatty) acid ligase
VTFELLVASDAPAAVLAYRNGRPIGRLQYVADVAALAARLPRTGTMLNLSIDRYRFAVGLGAALLREQTSLLPPNQALHTLERLRASFDSVYALVEGDSAAHGLRSVRHDDGHAPLEATALPQIDSDLVAAYLLTSGSTGEPMPHGKPWGLLVAGARALAKRLARAMGRQSLVGTSLVATMPPQHMFGFEASVLLALHGGAAFDTARPFYPADVAAALERAPAPRLLVTTPFHLKTLLDSDIVWARADLILSATAPLAPQLAARAEAAFGGPLIEIYGCTEAGQVAWRRTSEGPDWQVFENLTLRGDGDAVIVSGGHVPQATLLADVLEMIASGRFRLLGRSNDLVNIAGKRSSIAHLNFHLNAIDGVIDGSFWMPPESAGTVARLVAFVVAPDVAPERIRAALRQRIDPVFLPRRIVAIDALPRDATGKLATTRLAEMAAAQRV